MDTCFESCFPLSLKYEGGAKYTNIPQDRGGPTKYGIALNTFAKDTGDLDLFDLDGDGEITANDIKMLNYDRAKEIYKKYFWDKMYLDEINSCKKAFLVFDSTLNHGPSGSCGLVQKTLIRMNLMSSEEYDKDWGPHTRDMLNQADEDSFVSMFQQTRTDYYNAIVAKRPNQSIFLKGWLSRVSQTSADVETL